MAKGTGTGNEVETYTLTVTYTAYKLNESGRPEANSNNGKAGPGTEVGGAKAGDTLPKGKGTVNSTNVHKVYVIEGTIRVWKEIDDALKSSADQTYTFTLYRQTTATDEEGNETTTQEPVGEAQTVSVEAGETMSEAAAQWTNLPRGEYVVVETAGEEYVLESITVKTDTTNCYSTGSGTISVTFTLGNDTTNSDVIGRSAENDRYTSYTGTPNGVLGEAVVKNIKKEEVKTSVTVNKTWDDGGKDHSKDSVKVWLYRDGKKTSQSVELNAENGWTGTFSDLPVTDPDDKHTYTYTVEEEAVNGYTVKYQYDAQHGDGTKAVWLPADGLVDGETYIIVTSEGTGSVTGMEATSKGFAWTSSRGAGTINVSSSSAYARYITDEEASEHTAMQWTAASVGLIKGEQVGSRYAYTLKNVKYGKYAKDNGQGELTEKANGKEMYWYYGYTSLDANGTAAERQPSNDQSDWSHIFGSMNDYFPLEDNHTGDGNATKAQKFYLYRRVEATESVTTVTITNTKQYSLPKTGGSGTTLYTAGGIALVGGSLLYGYSKRRRREGRVE